jgi:hypothetical protein
MNELDPFAANVPNYRYGFLAASLSEILARPLGTGLSEEDLRQLALARDFLNEILAGVALVVKGEARNVSTTRAIGALDYALGPLHAMERAREISEDGLRVMFEEMQQVITESIANRSVSGRVASVATARQFFGQLSEGILAALGKQQRESDERIRAAMV